MRERTVVHRFGFLLSLILLTAVPASGLDPERAQKYYGYDFWGQAEGLSQATVRAVLQTRDGYLWLGTSGGLLRFDGIRFEQFSIRTGSLKDNEVRSLVEDDERGLWIATFGGGVTVCKRGRFTTFTTADGLPDNVVRKVCKDRNGSIWIATNKGVCRHRDGAFTSFAGMGIPATDPIMDLSTDTAGRVFAATKSSLYAFADGNFALVAGAVDKKDGNIRLLCSGADGSIWIASDSGVFKMLRGGTRTVYPVDPVEMFGINAMHEDPRGTLWVGATGGLWRLKDGRFEHIVPKSARLPLRRLRSIFTDHEGSLWIGTAADGLARIRETQLYTLSIEDGLADENVRSVLEDRDGNIWIGMASGLARYSDGRVTEITREGGAQIRVVALAEDGDGSILFSAGRGLYRLKSGRITPFPGWKEVRSSIRVICPEGASRLWVGTESDGLFRIDNGVITCFREENGMPSNAIRSILVDRSGGVWITTFGGGVCRYFDGKITRFPETQGLGASHAFDVVEDENGVFWFATRGGVLRFKDGRFSKITEADGLTSSYAFRIIDDGMGRLWFSSAMGVFHVSKADLDAFADGRVKAVTSVSYGVKNGMRTDVCSVAAQPSGFRTRDGRLLFCTLKGLSVVDSGNIHRNALAPPVGIERVIINRTPVDAGEFAEIAPGKGEVEIHYAGLSYLIPEKVFFRYKLEGIDPDWIDGGTRRFAYYAQLPPGSYVFRVMACNNDGVWNEGGASFAFRLKPHYYQTVLFYVLCALILALGVAGGVELRMRQLKARERLLAKRVEEAVAHLRVLRGLLPICASCKKVRDDKGYWRQVEVYFRAHSQVEFSHSICPDCMTKLYPEFAEDRDASQTAS